MSYPLKGDHSYVRQGVRILCLSHNLLKRGCCQGRNMMRNFNSLRLIIQSSKLLCCCLKAKNNSKWQRKGVDQCVGGKGVLDDKVEVAEESVTNFSISKSSEHSYVVQETFNLSHNLSE